MGQEKSFDLSGLTEDQKKAIEALIKTQREKKSYFVSLGAYPSNKINDFRDANRMKESTDPDEQARGKNYERALMESCGYTSQPPS
ncbi:MAG: hypothetical protein ACAH17_00345 [Candidatus Paceibacterota bacterium]